MKNRKISLLMSFVLLGAFLIGCNPPGPGAVATPSMNPPAGTYDSAQLVTLVSDTSEAEIFYTLDGSAPSQNSFAYAEPILIEETTTIKAKAFKDGLNPSAVASALYIIDLSVVAIPTASLASGTYTGVQNVSLTSATAGATIYYTLDNSDPHTGTLYSEALVIDKTCTLKAIAKKDGLDDSAILSINYTIVQPTPQVATPVPSLPAGTYEGTQNISLSTTTAGAIIFYTTDGTTPSTGSNQYSAPIVISETSTIKAIANKTGMLNSAVLSARYVIEEPEIVTVAKPQANMESGTYTGIFDVVLSTTTPDASIFYTLDGTAPSSDATLYIEPISIKETLTLKAIALKAGAIDSEILSVDYTLNIAAGVTTYPWPSEELPKYNGISFVVDGVPIDLYSVMLNNRPDDRYHDAFANGTEVRTATPVAMFDMHGSVEVSLVLPSAITVATVRPLNALITPTVNMQVISFTISEPGQYSVEWDYNPSNALLIFANPKEMIPEYTRLLDTGIHNENIELMDDDVLYMAPGAVLRGRVTVRSGSKIVGRGIIDGSQFNSWNLTLSDAQLPITTPWSVNTENIEIHGISIFDPDGWAMEMARISGLTIKNIKILSSRRNSDGISIQSSDNVLITKSFVRSWDDNIVVKNYFENNSHDIHVHDVNLWTDLAQSLEIGFETNKAGKNGTTNYDPRIYNVTFENIAIFHALHKAPISIHNGDNAHIYDIVFRDIVVEDYQAGAPASNGWDYLIDFTNLNSEETGGDPNWTTELTRGSIFNVLVENIYVVDRPFPNPPKARFDGSATGGSMHHIFINDINGKGLETIDLSDYVIRDDVNEMDIRFNEMYAPTSEIPPAPSKPVNLTTWTAAYLDLTASNVNWHQNYMDDPIHLHAGGWNNGGFLEIQKVYRGNEMNLDTAHLLFDMTADNRNVDCYGSSFNADDAGSAAIASGEGSSAGKVTINRAGAWQYQGNINPRGYDNCNYLIFIVRTNTVGATGMGDVRIGLLGQNPDGIRFSALTFVAL